MSKKRLLVVSGAVLVVLLVGLIGAAVVSAQEETPPGPPKNGPGLFGARRSGALGGPGMFCGGSWAEFDAIAEALGLTPTQLFAKLHGGKSVEEVAEEQGVEIDAVRDAVHAARTDAMRQGIRQAVAEGRMTQQQADWMLEGLEQGFFPPGRGFGGRPPRPPDSE